MTNTPSLLARLRGDKYKKCPLRNAQKAYFYWVRE